MKHLLTVLLLSLCGYSSFGQIKGNWRHEDYQSVYKSCSAFLEKDHNRSDEICNCIKRQVASTYAPEEFKKLSDSAKQNFFGMNQLDCFMGSPFGDEVEKEFLHQLREMNNSKNYEGEEKVLLEMIRLGYDSWDIFSSLGFTQLCLKKYDEAKRNLEIGLADKPDDLFLQGNLGNYFLLTGDYKKAIKIFKANKDKKIEADKVFQEAVSDDLKEFESLGIVNADFEKVRKELQIDWGTSFVNTGERGKFKKIIFDKKLDTSIFKTLSSSESYYVERPQNKDKKDDKENSDFLNNRGKLILESVNGNESIKQKAINNKATPCYCYYDNDTFFVQMNTGGGGGWFGPTEGLGIDVQIIGDKFSSSFNRWSGINKVYAESRTDTTKNYILVDNEQQELHLRKKLTFKSGEIIYGLLKFKTKTYFISENKTERKANAEKVSDIIDERFQGAVYFKCNKLKSRRVEWKVRKNEPPIILQAPYHFFDILPKYK